MLRVESLILSSLLHNERYGRKVMPFLTPEYFNGTERQLFTVIKEYVTKYNQFPNKTELLVEVEDLSISQDQHDELVTTIKELRSEEVQEEWLVEQTEKHCKEKAVYNAVLKAIHILDNKDDKLSPNNIPSILEDALSVSFDTDIGHDFIENAEERYEFYHKKEVRIPFDLEYLNKVTKGGLPRKTLNVILAGTGVGKSLFMCHSAAANLVNGKNVLYITMEMAEERIAERIDANLLNIDINELELIPRDSFKKRVEKLKEQTLGKLIIKEYPTSSAGSAHFRHLLNELKLKKRFIPDIIYIDYLNICSSSRMKHGPSVNSYTYIKSIAEEIRGLAVEFNVPIVSATQTNRTGFVSSDIGLEDTSESFGLPATVDFMIAMISSEELQELDQIMFKQLKNRYADPSFYKRFVVGVDRKKMRLYDVEQTAQDDVMEHAPMKKDKFNKEVFKDFT